MAVQNLFLSIPPNLSLPSLHERGKSSCAPIHVHHHRNIIHISGISSSKVCWQTPRRVREHRPLPRACPPVQCDFPTKLTDASRHLTMPSLRQFVVAARESAIVRSQASCMDPIDATGVRNRKTTVGPSSLATRTGPMPCLSALTISAALSRLAVLACLRACVPRASATLREYRVADGAPVLESSVQICDASDAWRSTLRTSVGDDSARDAVVPGQLVQCLQMSGMVRREQCVSTTRQSHLPTIL